MVRKAVFLLFSCLLGSQNGSFAQQAASNGAVFQQVAYKEAAAGNLVSARPVTAKESTFIKMPKRVVNDSVSPAARNKNLSETVLPKNSAGSNGNNMAKGFDALAKNITGIDNTAHGYMSMQNNTSGFGNTATGVSTLQFNTTGMYNTANGSYALANNTAGERNTAFGAMALSSNTSGSANTAVGYQSLLAISAGENNTSIGHNALTSATIASGNTSVGANSLYGNKIGNNNTAVGTNTLNENMRGSNNVATGVRALEKNMSGDNNTAVGSAALTTNISGNYNTVVGYSADIAADGISNATALGNGARALASNTVQLGNNAVSEVTTSGTLNATGLVLNSDLRLRQNIVPVDNALAMVLQLNPVRYQRKNSFTSASYSKTENGFIAQEIQKVMPFIVTEGADKDRLLSVDYISVIPVLTKAIQEQQALIQKQSDDIRELKKLVQQMLDKK